jgi:hypothetical protein
MLFAVGGLVLALTIGASLVGIRVGRRMRAGMADPERTELYGVQASLLGLLALLLGFSFAMAQTRFDLRKQLALEETNAIGTARLRAGLIADEPGREIRLLLEEYVAVRVRATRAGDDASLRAALAESERIQGEIWSRARAAAQREPRSLPVSLLVQSLNDVIDSHTKRLTVARNHVPTAVLVMLLLVATIAMGWVGACVGTSARGGGRATTVILSLLISMVVTVIVDLDQPRRGFILVGQTALEELERSFR